MKVSVRNGEWEDVSLDGRPFGAPTRQSGGGSPVADYRMAGVFDMACAIAAGGPHRANAELALHVLETMEALERSAAEGRRILIESRCARPAPRASR